MDGTFIACIIAVLLAVIALFIGDIDGFRVRKVAVALFAIAGLFLGLSCFTYVGTNKVGILTSFGETQDAVDDGLHPKAPWVDKKAEFDGTRQFLKFDGKGNDEEDLDKKVFPRIEVKLDGNATAWISGTISWQMSADTKEEKENAKALFKTYRTFERMTENFVLSSSRKALGEVFAKHNPLVDEKNQPLGELNRMAAEQLNEEFAGELKIMSVDLAVPDYDDATDKAIGEMQAQKAKTGLAQEEVKTNTQKALANAALVANTQLTALINQANCIQVAKETGGEPGYCMMTGGSTIVDTTKPSHQAQQ